MKRTANGAFERRLQADYQNAQGLQYDANRKTANAVAQGGRLGLVISEMMLGATPVGIALDIKDLAEATANLHDNPSWWNLGFFVLGILAVAPVVGDAAKGASRLGDDAIDAGSGLARQADNTTTNVLETGAINPAGTGARVGKGLDFGPSDLALGRFELDDGGAGALHGWALRNGGAKTYGQFPTPVGAFGFDGKIRAHMDQAAHIRFNLQEITEKRTKLTGHLDKYGNPVDGYTNHELYLIKTNKAYRDKTSWYNGDELLPGPPDWLRRILDNSP